MLIFNLMFIASGVTGKVLLIHIVILHTIEQALVQRLSLTTLNH